MATRVRIPPPALKYEEAYKLLLSYVTGRDIIEHCKAVSNFLYEIGGKVITKHPELQIDLEKLKIAGLLHNIGKQYGEPHAVKGAEILRKHGLDEIASIIEKHGLTYELTNDPRYLPKTLEEKLLAYADLRIKGTEVVTPEERLEDLMERRDKSLLLKAYPRFKLLAEEIEKLIN